MTEGRGLRKIAYTVSTATLLGTLVVGWTGVLLGVLPPHPTDDYAGAAAFCALWMAVFAYVDNRGEKRTWQQVCERTPKLKQQTTIIMITSLLSLLSLFHFCIFLSFFHIIHNMRVMETKA